jgi:rhomboid family GlyGly-CTERM serine protease
VSRAVKRFPLLTFATAAFALAVHASPQLTLAFQLDRKALAAGNLWLLATGHFTHFGADHLLWDLIAFLAFGSLVEMRSRRAWCYCLMIGALVVSAGVSWLQPQIVFYRGLSGLDSALFAFVVTDLIHEGWRARDRIMMTLGAAALAGFLVKCAYELASGQAFFVESGDAFQPVPLAHLLGAVVGVLVALPRRQAPAFNSSTDLRNDLLEQ